MPYSIDFHPKALEQWVALDHSVRVQFTKKLAKLAESPMLVYRSLAGSLSGHYKIKIHSTGHRLIFRIDNEIQRIFIVGVGRRDGGVAYDLARENL